MESELLTLKEIAKLIGVSVATVNYYTNLGLFQTVDRRGNRRLYSKQAILVRFETIKKMRRQGYSLTLIHQKLLGA